MAKLPSKAIGDPVGGFPETKRNFYRSNWKFQGKILGFLNEPSVTPPCLQAQIEILAGFSI